MSIRDRTCASCGLPLMSAKVPHPIGGTVRSELVHDGTLREVLLAALMSAGARPRRQRFGAREGCAWDVPVPRAALNHPVTRR